MSNKGDFIKRVGDYSGAYFDGHKWQGFKCVGCMYAMGLIHPDNHVCHAKYGTYVNRTIHKHGYKFSHDKVLHDNWVKEGKPIRKHD